MSESEDNQQPQNTNYLEQAMFPGDKLPAYAHISSKLQASHYAAVEASTELGNNIIGVVKELKDKQIEYYDNIELFKTDTVIGLNDLKQTFLLNIFEHKKFFNKKKPKKYVDEIKEIRTKYFFDVRQYKNERKQDQKDNYEIYCNEVNDIAAKVKKQILTSYQMHVLYQYTHGVSVKGQGRKEATGLGISKNPNGTPLKEHKRSRMDKLFNRNKEPAVNEVVPVGK